MIRRYELRKNASWWEVAVLHADGSPFRICGDVQFLTHRGFSHRPTRFYARQSAEAAWAACREVYNDTVPQFVEVVG